MTQGVCAALDLPSKHNLNNKSGCGCVLPLVPFQMAFPAVVTNPVAAVEDRSIIPLGRNGYSVDEANLRVLTSLDHPFEEVKLRLQRKTPSEIC